MSQSLSAEVANVVRAEPSPGRPERYEVHLDLKPERDTRRRGSSWSFRYRRPRCSQTT